MAPKILPISISEIFGPTIQGEGILIGRPTVFVRTGGCDYRCSWCDTMYAVDPKYHDEWTPMMPNEILDEIRKLVDHPILITLSGGNPALQSLQPLIEQGQELGYKFTLETQGSVSRGWFSFLDYLTISPKGPSSGNVTPAKLVVRCIEDAYPKPEINLKVVVFNEEDLAYATEIRKVFDDIPMVLQVGNADVDPEASHSELRNELLDQYRDLVDRTLKHPVLNSCIVLPQIHTLLWGNKRGV